MITWLLVFNLLFSPVQQISPYSAAFHNMPGLTQWHEAEGYAVTGHDQTDFYKIEPGKQIWAGIDGEIVKFEVTDVSHYRFTDGWNMQDLDTGDMTTWDAVYKRVFAKDILTLYTCYYNNKQRVIITAIRAD